VAWNPDARVVLTRTTFRVEWLICLSERRLATGALSESGADDWV
jgi:hypothetical protein